MPALQIKKEDFSLYNDGHVSAEQSAGNWIFSISWFKTSTYIIVRNDYIGMEVEYHIDAGETIDTVVSGINAVLENIYNEVSM